MQNIVQFNDLQALELFCLEKGANGITELLIKEIKDKEFKIQLLTSENTELKSKLEATQMAMDDIVMNTSSV